MVNLVADEYPSFTLACRRHGGKDTVYGTVFLVSYIAGLAYCGAGCVCEGCGVDITGELTHDCLVFSYHAHQSHPRIVSCVGFASWRIELDFIGQRPTNIWHYQKKTWFQRPGTPDNQHTVHVNDGHAAVQFRHLHDGLWTGIAWTWQ